MPQSTCQYESDLVTRYCLIWSPADFVKERSDTLEAVWTEITSVGGLFCLRYDSDAFLPN